MTDYEKLKEIIDEIDVLISKGVTSSTPDFQAWKIKTERFLVRLYGKKVWSMKNLLKPIFHYML